MSIEYQVGKWSVQPQLNQIVRGDETLRLEPRTMKLLELLIEHQGQVISKQQITELVWDKEYVSENAINMTISLLRKTLGDNSKQPSYIQTVPKRGYRLIAEVRNTSKQISNNHGNTTKPRWATLLVGIFFAVLATSLVWYFQQSAEEQEQPLKLFVMPIHNLTGDSEYDYLSHAIGETLATRLAMQPGLSVGISSDPDDMNREQLLESGRNLWLEGGLVRNGNSLESTIRVSQGSTGELLWAESYLIDENSFQSTQSRIITQLLQHFLDQEPQGQTFRQYDPEAYTLYLKGKYFQALGGRENLIKGFEYYQDVIRIEPDFAEAYAGLADIYSYKRGHYVEIAPDVALEHAKSYLNQALSINPDLMEAHISQALLNLYQLWDVEAAYQSASNAINLRPDDAHAQYVEGMVLAAKGELEQSMKTLDLAYQTDPLSPTLNWDRAWVYFLAGHTEQAYEISQEALRYHSPNLPTRRFRYTTILLANNKLEEALAVYRSTLNWYLDEAPGDELTNVLKLLEGDDELAAIETLCEYLDQPLYARYWSMHRALLNARIGRNGAALRALESARDHFDPNILWVPYIPAFSHLELAVSPIVLGSPN